MRLAQFIKTTSSRKIVPEWEEFARTCFPGMNVEERRDHVQEMLMAIALDLETPQSAGEQAEKSKGKGDAHVDGDTAANAHGTDRAEIGYTPAQMVSEFRALRASVLRLWSQAKTGFTPSDLDEVFRFNEAIDQALAESIARYAQEVDRSKDLFLGVLGHDLRRPLGAIVTEAKQFLTEEAQGSPRALRARRIVESGARMDAIIAELLDFTRSRLGGGIPVACAEIDVEAVCRQTVDEFTALHPDCIVHFEASGDLSGEWDRDRIGQALCNLVGNAYHLGAKNAPVEVALRASRGPIAGEADGVVLTVHNKGGMIAKADLKEIFNPFNPIDPARPKTKDLGRVGLGLYITAAIVTAHHGTIEVESTRSGTTFTVRLPRSLSSHEIENGNRDRGSRRPSRTP